MGLFVYLVRRKNTWWAMHDIPRPLRKVFDGQARFAESLKTSDKSIAKAKGAVLEAAWRKRVNEAQKSGAREDIGDMVKALFPEDVQELVANLVRAYMAAAPEEKPEYLSAINEYVREDAVQWAAMSEEIHDYSDPRFHQLPVHDEVKKFMGLVKGERVRFGEHLDEYIGTLRTVEKTKDLRRGSIRKPASASPTSTKLIVGMCSGGSMSKPKKGRPPRQFAA
ncbi:MAG: DUF6538 domain-containing protein [Candidatus Hydrogenedentales bacterium]|jgi:hypothetical protein